MQKNKNSTIELHNIKQDIYLGYLADQTFQPTPLSFEVSFFGGYPVLLKQLNEKQQTCDQCKATLSFLGQIYCPFDAEHCYHRILYLLICEGCLRGFKCIRQQTTKDYKPDNQIKSKLKKICQAKQLDNEAQSKNQFIKIVNRIKTKIQEDQIIEQADSDEQDQKEIMREIQQPRQQMKKVEELIQKQQIEEKKMQPSVQKHQQQQKDLIFQVYRSVITELNNPCILYTDTPLPYNKRTLNPQHFCESCGAKLTLQVQITERILNISSDPNSKLLMMDWGSLMIYTCGASCSEGSEQCLVAQYQIDAVNEQDLKKLKKTKKNRKKKQKKSKSKEKQVKIKQKVQDDSDSSEQLKNEGNQKTEQKTKQEGDWD